MRVLIVWEPILPTDWSSPSGSTLQRIPDSRVKQFYDPNHIVSGKLREFAAKHPPQPEPKCCVQKGFYWDQAILYPRQVHWNDDPGSDYWNGPVVKIISDLERTLNGQH
jgi:hypothetical protein